MKHTGTVFQVLVMDSSLPGDWLYDRVMLQPLGAAGTVENTKRHANESRNVKIRTKFVGKAISEDH